MKTDTIHAAIEGALEDFDAMIAEGRLKLAAHEVMDLVDDICISTKSRLTELPPELQVIRKDAKDREDAGSSIPFVVRRLIDSFSRAQSPALSTAQ